MIVDTTLDRLRDAQALAWADPEELPRLNDAVNKAARLIKRMDLAVDAMVRVYRVQMETTNIYEDRCYELYYKVARYENVWYRRWYRAVRGLFGV